MKRKLPLFVATFLMMALLCSVAFADRSPALEDADVDDASVPPVEILVTPIEVEAAVDENGAAIVEVSSSDLFAAMETANSEGSVRVSVRAKGADNASKVTTVLPKEALKAIAEQTNAELQVESATGQMTMPNAVLTSVVENASGDSVRIVVSTQSSAYAQALLDGKVAVDAAQIAAGSVAEVSSTSGSTAITELSGGSATIALPVGSGDFQEDMSYTIYQAGPDDSVHTFVGQCMMVDDQLRVVLTADRLGTFVVLPEAVASSTAAEGYNMVMSPLASGAAAEAEASTLSAAVRQWCDTALMQLLQLFGL